MSEEPLLDALLREAVPEIKLALGDVIDRDNARSLPDRYARLLPETTLLVTLRPDAGEALLPVAAELEREMTESCTRHGSLYDRVYKVSLRGSQDPGAPLFRVSVDKGDAPAPPSLAEVAAAAPPPPPAPAPRPRTVAADGPPPSEATVAAPEPRRGPSIDPDATRLDFGVPSGWEDGRWELAVEDEDGTERESFPLPGAVTTVGRRSDNPALTSDLMLTGAPHVSRRQVALVWDPRGGEPGFRVHNVGLNPVHLEGRAVPGANVGKGPLMLEEIGDDHRAWLAPGTPLRVGEHGPVLRIRDTGTADEGESGEPEEDAGPAIDPDATHFG